MKFLDFISIEQSSATPTNAHLTVNIFFRMDDHMQQTLIDQQRQRRLRHKQQLNKPQIKYQLKNRKKEEQFKHELRHYQQRYETINKQQMDDEPDEKWKFYQHSR